MEAEREEPEAEAGRREVEGERNYNRISMVEGRE